jgi:hypothetical protein
VSVRPQGGPLSDGPAHAWGGRHTIGLTLLVLIAWVHVAPFLGYLTDDTFIHLQFAKNIVSGRGFSFEPGKPTYGDTSPGWALLLAATGRLVPHAGETPSEAGSMPALATIAKAWGALCLALSVVVLARLGSLLGWRPRLALAAAALLALHAWSARWALSGMETPMATLFAVLATWATARALLQGRGTFLAGVLLGVGTLARPECWLLAALGVAAIAYGSGAGRAARAGKALAGVLLGGGPWLLYAWSTFHRFLPNTSAAKAGAPFDPALAASAIRTSIRIALATDALPLLLLVLALAAAPALWKSMPRERRALWLLVIGWPVLLTAGLAAGGVQVVSRYLVPAVPSVLLAGIASFQWAAARLGPRRAAAALFLVLLLDAGVNGYVTLRYSAPHARRHTAGLRSSLATFGLWARASTPPGTRFAVSDIGAFGYYSDRPVLDLFGLVTPEMAPIVVRAGYDAVVENLLFEKVGRPAYLLDRATEANRLASDGEPSNPYHFVAAHSIPDLGITRPRTYVYSLYAIRWEVYDSGGPHLALATGEGPPGRDTAPSAPRGD